MSVDATKSKVQRILTEQFGSATIDSDGDFVVDYESAVAFVRVTAYGDDQSAVQVFCHMLRDVPLTDEVYRWVATEGQLRFFGRARVASDDHKTGTILFDHVLLGDYLDSEELVQTVFTVVLTANEHDDTLQGKFGGKKSTD